MTLDTSILDLDRLHDGAVIDRYRVRRWLARGRSGDVYEALQLTTGRPVALKLAWDGDAGAGASIQREIDILARLEHAAIVPLIDAGAWQGRPYLVTALARAGTLAARTQTPWPLAAALPLLRSLADALDAVHALGIVHRDVCAGNVLLDGTGHSWLADFGVALLPGEAPFTGDEVIVTGTPDYVAPEVVRGARPSPASDRYALGVLAFLLLCGVLPVRGSTDEEVLAAQLRPLVARPSAINPLLPPAVEDALLRALSPEPGERFPSAAVFVEALAGAGSHGEAGGAAMPAAVDAGAADAIRAGEQLERFARTLPPSEQAALFALLRQREAEIGRARAALQTIASRAFGPAAALLALEDTGVAALLAASPATAAGLAQAGAGSETILRLLLDYLAHRGLVARDGDRYALLPEMALLYAPARGRQHPLREGWVFWSHLPARAAGAPPAQTMDTDEGSVYEGTVRMLADLSTEAATEAAEALDIGGQRRRLRVLEVGAGSGVWSRAMAQRDPELRVTALDRPRVLEVTRRYAAEGGTEDRLTCLAGDMHTAELPAAAYDLVILANVLHLEPGERIVPLLRRLRAALTPGGELAIIDIIPERMAAADGDEHLMGLHLALRTPAGKLHDAEEYRAWLREAGFQTGDLLPLKRGTGGLGVLVSRAYPPSPLL